MGCLRNGSWQFRVRIPRSFVHACLVGTLAVLGLGSGTAYCAITANSATLPADGFYTGSGGRFNIATDSFISIAIFPPMTHQFIPLDLVQRDIVLPDTIYTGPSRFTASAFLSSPNGVQDFTLQATGNLNVRVRNDGQDTGSFETEMHAEMLTGTTSTGVPFRLRENPNIPSTGHDTITKIGDQYQIESFFDVFAELSLDGGTTWIPDSDAPMRVTLIPEPSTLTMGIFAVGAALALIARRRRSL